MTPSLYSSALHELLIMVRFKSVLTIGHKVFEVTWHSMHNVLTFVQGDPKLLRQSSLVDFKLKHIGKNSKVRP